MKKLSTAWIISLWMIVSGFLVSAALALDPQQAVSRGSANVILAQAAMPTPNPKPISESLGRILGLTTPPDVFEVLSQMGIAADSGLLGDYVANRVVDATGEDNTNILDTFDGNYRDVIVKATFGWGPGAAEDECGLEFENTKGGNAYYVYADRTGLFYFQEFVDNEWRDVIFGDGSSINTAPDGLNDLVVTAIGDQMTVTINGQEAGHFRTHLRYQTQVSMLVGTYASSDETFCVFRDSWVWDLKNAGFSISPEEISSSNSNVLSGLALVGVSPQVGGLGDYVQGRLVDASEADNLNITSSFEGVYDTFVVGAIVAWGPGPSRDECGFELANVNDGNKYEIYINRQGALTFDQYVDDAWGDFVYGNGTLLKRGPDDLNFLVALVDGDQITVYINGERAGRFQAEARGRVYVSMLAGTYEGTEETYCTYTDAWVWDIGEREAVTNQPTPLPTPMPSASITDALSQIGIDPSDGYLAADVERIRVLQLNSAPLEGRYQNFVIGLTFEWGPDRTQNFCGVSFRESGFTSTYTIDVAPWGQVRFGVVSIGDREISLSESNLIQGAENDRNTMILAVIDDVFTVYINGQYATQFQDDSLMEAGVANLYTGSLNPDGESYCNFSDVWLWDLGDSSPEISVPPPRPFVFPGVNVTAVLSLVGLGTDEGHVATGLGELVLRVPKNERTEERRISGTYDNFVMATTLTWGHSTPGDQCGILFRRNSDGDSYLLTVNQYQEIEFSRLYADEAEVQVSDAIHIGFANTNSLVLAAFGSSFRVYINWQFVAEFVDQNIDEGGIRLGIISPNLTGGSECMFTDTWIWQLD